MESRWTFMIASLIFLHYHVKPEDVGGKKHEEYETSVQRERSCKPRLTKSS